MKNLTGYRRPGIFFVPLFILLAAATVALFAACVPPVGGTQASGNGSAGRGTLELAIEKGAKTILPSDASAYTITDYVVQGIGIGSENEGASFVSSPFSATSFRVSGLIMGGWRIAVYGYNSGGHLVASTIFTAAVSADSVSSQTVYLERIAGNGSVDVTVNWEVASDYDAATGTLTPVGGSAETLSLAIAAGGNSLRYLATKPAGNYVLSIQLKKSGSVKETLTEAVQVYSGYTSAKTLDRSISHAASTFAYNASWPVCQVNFAGASSKTLTVTGAAGHSLYLVKSNQAAASASAATTGSASSVSEKVPYSRSLVEPEAPEIPDPGRPLRFEHAEAAAFNANPPPVGSGGSGSKDLAPGRSSTISYGSADPALSVDTSYKYFWVQAADKSWFQSRATLRAVGRYCYIWVADANYSNTSAANDDDMITSAQAAALRDKFDGTPANSYKDGIYLNVSTIFGNEYGGGPGGSGGRDGDQHISILVYDVDQDYVSTQTGGTLGYFWGKDYYSQADLGYSSTSPRTNYAEIFYVDAHFTDKYQNYVLSTLAHEYQHMIHFNVKSIAQGLSEPAWLNEMCSMVGEDLVCRNIGLDPATYGAVSRLPEFLYHYPESGVTDWLASPNTLKSYASAFAFGAYLARNYGGASLFQRILSNNQTGEAAVSAALSAEGYGDDFVAAFSHYGEALLFSDKPSGSALKTLKQAWSESLGGISYVAESIDLAAVRQYNLDTQAWVGNYGPRNFDPATAVDLRPYGNSIHTRTAWKNLTGDLAVTLNAPSDADVKFYLMVK